MKPRGVRVESPGRVSASIVGLARLLRPVLSVLWRPTLTGTENLPKTGPFLLVANHSGGLAIAEIFCFAALYLEKVGAERPLAGFAHWLGFHLCPLKIALRHVGAIPSTYEAAESTLAAGVPVLVFPGGDYEGWRPIWEAHRVDFGGRKGFLRIARKMRVPIVPMGIRGSHFTVPTLWRSRWILPNLLVLPRLIGLKRFPLTLLGLAGALALALLPPWTWYVRAIAVWGWLVSPLVFIPFVPSTIRMAIGAPIEAGSLFPDDDDDGDAALAPALAHVEREVQRLVDVQRSES